MEIDAELALRLVASQFPQWAGLPVRPVSAGGWDNRTFRLGDNMLIRMPSAHRYAAQVEKEQAWLPRLAPALPLPIPRPLAMGAPGEGYPWPWSIYGWIEGEPASVGPIADLPRFAADLATFLAALQRIDPRDGPVAGAHSFYRGGPLETYDAEVRQAVAVLGDRIDANTLLAVWDAGLTATWNGPPVWVHGDIAASNLLIRGGALSAVLDFGCCAVGDPACDLAIAWTCLDREARDVFRARLSLDAACWARGRGWTLWKALIVMAAISGANPADRDRSSQIIAQVLDDHRRA